MKFIFTLMATASLLFVNPIEIQKESDEMTDNTFFFANKVWLAKKHNQLGWIIRPHLSKNGTETLRVPPVLFVTHVGLGSCHSNDEIIFLFEKEEGEEKEQKLILQNSNRFSCENDDMLFFLDQQDWNLLSSHKIKKVRLTNGYTYDSLTLEIKEKDKKEYFINLAKAISSFLEENPETSESSFESL